MNSSPENEGMQKLKAALVRSGYSFSEAAAAVELISGEEC